MTGELTGTAGLVRLALRRDRWLIPAWVGLFAAMAAFSSSATAGLYPDRVSRLEAANTINSTASAVALYGPIYDPTSLGSLSIVKMTAVYTALMSILMVMLVVRHTRAEEEAGRLELVGAGVVGRAAPLAAALLVVGGTSCVLGLLAAGGLMATGLPTAGSLIFGAGWAATGLCFAAVAGVAAQVTTGGRAANGLGFMVIALAYVARAIGGLAETGPGGVARLSSGIRRGPEPPGGAVGGWKWLADLPGGVTAAIVDDEDLVRDAGQGGRDVGHQWRQRRFFVVRGDDDGNLGDGQATGHYATRI
mgnify:CR=1 FL=1